MSEMQHHAHGVLWSPEAEFERIGVLFAAGPTRPGEHAQMHVSLSVRNNSEAAIPFTLEHYPALRGIELVDASGTVRAR